MAGVIGKRITALLLTLSLFTVQLKAFEGEKLNVTVVQQANAQEVKKSILDEGVFGWSSERKLTWGDFRGSLNHALGDETAASICHGFGVQTDTAASKGNNVVVNVFNVFYPHKSWVRDGGQSASVLAHEQTHFDICELYTRILKERITQAYLTKGNFNVRIKQIYEEVQAEYIETQEEYERQTNHGLIASEQLRWQNNIQMKLSVSTYALR